MSPSSGSNPLTWLPVRKTYDLFLTTLLAVCLIVPAVIFFTSEARAQCATGANTGGACVPPEAPAMPGDHGNASRQQAPPPPPAAHAQTPCAEDIAAVQDMTDKALADHSIERDAYEAGLQRLSRIRAVCASGDDKLARALAMQSVIALELATDDAYARSRNADRPPR